MKAVLLLFSFMNYTYVYVANCHKHQQLQSPKEQTWTDFVES